MEGHSLETATNLSRFIPTLLAQAVQIKCALKFHHRKILPCKAL